MAFAQRLLKTLDRIRAIPGRMGLHVYSVQVLVGAWSGAHTGDGTETQSITLLTNTGQNPRVRWMNDEEIAVGQLHQGTAEIGPFTPPFLGGGVDARSFGALLNRGETIHVVITGPSHPTGAKYRVLHAHQESALGYKVKAEPVTEQV
jgi:hypothetical protein